MKDRLWVVNASPLILLGKISQLSLLTGLATHLVIPSGVISEINRGSRNDPARKWIKGPGKEYQARLKTINPRILSWDLGLGETEVLSYALDNPGFTAIVDDGAARTCAKNLDVPVVGTLGTILLAKKENLISEASPVLEQIQEAGARISDELIKVARKLAGEE